MSRDDRIALAFLGLHPDRRRALVELHGGPRRVMRLARRGAIEGVDPSRVPDPPSATEAMERAGCRAVLWGDPGYPQMLEDLENPPDVLFVAGEVPSEPAVAIVGTRRCTGYGDALALGMGAAVASAGWPLVSGLARGIDGSAHRGTVAGGGIGFAVLGSGSDVVYPREHRALHDRLIASGGGVLTEYPPGTAPQGWRFPPRNRIISGLSRAVVVVEAARTGGALLTAALAAEQGRVVFAVPGDVDREASVGCNLLIRDGAIPVLGADDLIEGLSLVLGPPRRAAPAGALDGLEAAIVAAIHTPMTVERVVATIGSPAGDVLAAVGRLEVSGALVREGDLLVARRTR